MNDSRIISNPSRINKRKRINSDLYYARRKAEDMPYTIVIKSVPGLRQKIEEEDMDLVQNIVNVVLACAPRHEGEDAIQIKIRTHKNRQHTPIEYIIFFYFPCNTEFTDLQLGIIKQISTTRVISPITIGYDIQEKKQYMVVKVGTTHRPITTTDSVLIIQERRYTHYIAADDMGECGEGRSVKRQRMTPHAK